MRWTASALSDLARIRGYIGHFNPYAARRLSARLAEAADRLGDLAERGRPIGRGRRELLVIWPYAIRYRIFEDAVVILRVRHGFQAPD